MAVLYELLAGGGGSGAGERRAAGPLGETTEPQPA